MYARYVYQVQGKYTNSPSSEMKEKSECETWRSGICFLMHLLVLGTKKIKHQDIMQLKADKRGYVQHVDVGIL